MPDDTNSDNESGAKCAKEVNDLYAKFRHFRREVAVCEKAEGTPESEMGTEACRKSVLFMARSMTQLLRRTAECPDRMSMEGRSLIVENAEETRQWVDQTYENAGLVQKVLRTLRYGIPGYWDGCALEEHRGMFEKPREELEEAIKETKPKIFGMG